MALKNTNKIKWKYIREEHYYCSINSENDFAIARTKENPKDSQFLLEKNGGIHVDYFPTLKLAKDRAQELENYEISMTYTERKTQEILNVSNCPRKIENIIKEIIKDVRHKCAENCVTELNDAFHHSVNGSFHQVIMNTEME